ncbi:MAG TPA: tRNA (adenosine(37)-N6)-threonylcarbamoyltransferase complex ATPase subunit type 1 TsaE [Nitrospirae bacterium]|nr:tRNA threonylcarbamoyladenosine biosynthesis protein TsaE [bacterium BMS3Abin06]HDH11486.1 tRNA (adenosine(37)-N6)-threonylcarbamoyltransferase complex ATPase subunit type 1 TsaE [Nitrospirota bacterium]HDZ01360.1 tRNA (adenosine(37)-N6)-threonylcarbamoyltransferase complex ATPase subunit type 1 TsaE [Nitrospirota bacterium]
MKLLSRSEAETREIGRKLGEKLKSGDVVCLYGELGSGKTTMVQGIASAFGISERDITSASFTIIAEYDAGTPFYHIDLYRVTPGEVPELGLQEYLGSAGISVIEWAERAEGEIPDNSIRVSLNHKEEHSREIEIKGIRINRDA